jgi:hypothetical protein
MNQNYEITRGDDYTFTLAFKDSDGQAIDIAGYTVFFTLKEYEDDDDDDALITVDVTEHDNDAGGITTISLSNADTDDLNGTFFYDIQYKDLTGAIQTIQTGVITFCNDITRRMTDGQ